MSIINPVPIAKTTETTANTTGGSARERAINVFKAGQQAQTNPVQNPTNVAVEELGAITKSSESKEDPSKNVAEESSTEGQKLNTEAPKEATQETQPSPQLVQLARKERAIRQAQQDLKAREAALSAREEALKPKALTFDPSRHIDAEELAKDPWAILQKRGITYDQLTQQALNQPSPEQQALNAELASLRAELKAVKDGQDGIKNSYEESQKQSYQQAVTQIKNETKQLISSNPDNFEAISHSNSVDDVVKLIERTFHEEGTLMTVEEAANEVENYLLDRAIKLAGMKKVQQRLKPAAPAATSPQQDANAPKQSQAKPTLTNAVGTQRPLTPKERAILAFKGELKK